MYTLRTTVSHKQSSAKFQGSRRRIRAKPRDTKFQLQPYRTNVITVAAERNRRRDRLRETPGLTVDPWNLRYARRVLHDQVRIRVLARLEQILTPSASETPLVIRCSYTWDGRSCAPGPDTRSFTTERPALSLSVLHLRFRLSRFLRPYSLVSKGNAAFTELRSILSELILFVVARVPIPNPMNSF